MGRLLPALAALIAVLLTGCGNAAVLDPSPLPDFLDMHVKNNTGRVVTIADCGGSECTTGVGTGFRDTLVAGGARDEADWLNAQPGIAHVRVSSEDRTIGCLKIRYRKGQQHATALVSSAMPCNS